MPISKELKLNKEMLEDLEREIAYSKRDEFRKSRLFVAKNDPDYSDNEHPHQDFQEIYKKQWLELLVAQQEMKEKKKEIKKSSYEPRIHSILD